jgi:hypothetical protein
MRRIAALVLVLLLATRSSATAEDRDVDAETNQSANAVRVTLVRSGGDYSVQGVSGGGAGAHQGCAWSVVFVPDLADAPYGTSAGPMPDPAARFALLLCNGSVVRAIWVAPSDVIDLDAAARAEAERYVRDVLTPAVSIGVNPAAKGLAGLRSWFWIDGFAGSVTAPPISAFGLTIDVRMAAGGVRWDFGDGTIADGDLGRAYPEESTVQHAHRSAGSYRITATIALVPEYRVNGGGWITLPNLTAVAATTHQVEQRQPVVTKT